MDALKANALINILIEECKKYDLVLDGYEIRPPRGANFTRMPLLIDIKIAKGKKRKLYTIPVYVHSDIGEVALTIINNVIESLK